MKQKKIYATLMRERKSHLEDLVRALEMGETEKAKESLSWVEALDKLRATRSNERRWAGSIALGLCCLGIVVVAVTLRSSTSLAYIDVWAQEVSLRISRPCPVLLDVLADSMWVSDMGRLHSVTLNLVSEKNQSLGISARGHGVHLDSLCVYGTAQLRIYGDSTSMTIFISSKEIRGLLDFTNARLYQGGGTRQVSSLPGNEPYYLDFVSGSSEPIPMEIRLIGLNRWQMAEMALSAISFVTEIPEGSGRSMSSVDSGRVTIAETGEVTPIRSGDSLGLDLKQVSKSSLSGRARQIHSVLEARVGEVNRTSRTVRTDLMPRLIDSVSHNDMLRLLWGALVFLWGIGYGAWRLFRR